MKRSVRLASQSGFTVIEMMIAVAIISILVAIASASYDTLKAKARYAKMSGDMDAIAQAAYNDYTTHDSTWATDSTPGTAPSFMNSTDLAAWPSPPCPGWVYSWDNWIGFPANVARVTVRRADWTAIYSYCVQTLDSTCGAADFFGGTPANLSTTSTHDIFCNE